MGKKYRPSKEDKELEKQKIEQEIETLKKRSLEEAPACGYAPPVHQLVSFRALPLSTPTLRGLEDAEPTPFITMTAIQNACIPHALAGRDILGAANTGSGKTLAFVVPVLEVLYRHRFSAMDGPGALILSPTRELAVQIFQVLRMVGKHHAVSVGLLIGGKKDFYEEQQKVGTTNILIATPGRILQHLEQTPCFDVSGVRILVLDEADRVLDMGFRSQLIRILEYIPNEERQTLLFSATQTHDVSQLATLSLRRPEYLGVHDKEKTSTPESLQQSYIVVPLEHKLNAVYSFIKSHLKCKSILFFATCAQVRYAWQLFCSMRPGIQIMALHGTLVQAKRTQIYFDFTKKDHAVLFATDICARGLDFPNVDWVVQVDAPEDRDMYIHRAGRTARYRSGGKSLLFLTPSEEKRGFIDMLNSSNKKLPLKKLSLNPSKTVLMTQRAASLVAADSTLQLLAKKAYKSYVRSIFLMPKKNIFDVNDLVLDEYSKSMGLASAPNLRFLKSAAKDRDEFRERKNVNYKLQKLKDQIKAEKLAKKLRKMGKSDEEVEGLSKDFEAEQSNDSDRVDENEIILLKKRSTGDVKDDTVLDSKFSIVNTSRKPKKIRIDGPNNFNTRIVFNDLGDRADSSLALLSETSKTTSAISQDKTAFLDATKSYVEKVRQRLLHNADQDQDGEKERLKEKRKKRRAQEKGERQELGDVGGTVLLDFKPERDDDSNEDYSTDSSQSSKRSSLSSSDGKFMDATSKALEEQENLALSVIRGNQ